MYGIFLSVKIGLGAIWKIPFETNNVSGPLR